MSKSFFIAANNQRWTAVNAICKEASSGRARHECVGVWEDVEIPVLMRD